MESRLILEQSVDALLQWFAHHSRDLPWRKDQVAYHVWVSEIMLQQTRVEAVKDYYIRFLTQLPDVRSLAEAPEERLLKLWEGLGYYNRVRNMQKAAQILMKEYEGSFPPDYDTVLQLPGIGSYTAGAICSISFGIPVPAVDGNVLRVVSRLLGSYDDIGKAAVKKQIEQKLREVIPLDCPGIYNQAVMELGATLCGPNWEPRCQECPLQIICTANQRGIANELPVKAPKKPRRIEKKTILILYDGEKIAIQKRPDKGLLAGMYEFPKLSEYATQQQVLAYVKKMGLNALRIQQAEPCKHIFSHVEWHMNAFLVRTEDVRSQQMVLAEEEPVIFAEIEQIDQVYPMPSAFKKYRELIRRL